MEDVLSASLPKEGTVKNSSNSCDSVETETFQKAKSEIQQQLDSFLNEFSTVQVTCNHKKNMGVGSDTRIFEGGKVVDTNVCTASGHKEKISAMDSTAITSEDLRELRTEANGSLRRAGMSTMEMSRDDATSQSTKRCVSVDDTCSLESVHVRGVYDQIAPHIQDLKQRTWPRVKDFLDSLAPGSFVADIGCGNGRYLQANPSVVSLGLDTCQSFVEAASAKGSEVMSADNLSLPFRDEIFDAVLSVGVIHHFASLERRVRAVEELVRILSKGGRMMIYVWAFEQKYRRFDGQDILVPWHKPRKADAHRRQQWSSLDTGYNSAGSMGSSVSDDDSPCKSTEGRTSSTTCTCCHHRSSCKTCKREGSDNGGANRHLQGHPASNQMLMREDHKDNSAPESHSIYLDTPGWIGEGLDGKSTCSIHTQTQVVGGMSSDAHRQADEMSDLSCCTQEKQEPLKAENRKKSLGQIGKQREFETNENGCLTLLGGPDGSVHPQGCLCRNVLTGQFTYHQYKSRSKAIDESLCSGQDNTPHALVHYVHGLQHDSQPLTEKTSVIDIIKKSFRNLFSKTSSGNDQYSSACFVPCRGQKLPHAEHFQVRQFPKSSLLAHSVEENCSHPHDTVSQSCPPHDFPGGAVHEQKHETSNSNKPDVFCRIDQNNELLPENADGGQPVTAELPAITTTQQRVPGKKIPKNVQTGEASSQSKGNLKTVNTDLCRFYHVFREGELAELVMRYTPQVRIVDSFYDHANWGLVLEKM